MKPKLLKAVLYYDDGTAYEIEGEGAAKWQDAITQLGMIRVDGTKIDWRPVPSSIDSTVTATGNTGGAP